MKIRTEISDTDEIIIRCRDDGERVNNLKAAIECALKGENEIMLTLGSTEYFVPKNSILFFESCEGKVYAHTADRMYIAPHRLFELESLMPPSFVRISKSVIANILQIESLHREIVGNGEITFRGCSKKTYFSRAYFKLLQYKIDEMRLKR